MIKIATIEDEENIRQEIVRYIKKGIGSIERLKVCRVYYGKWEVYGTIVYESDS